MHAKVLELQHINFYFTNGIKQDGITSPILFTLYINKLVKCLTVHALDAT